MRKNPIEKAQDMDREGDGRGVGDASEVRSYHH